MDKVFTSLRRPAPRWVIDRVEEGWAVMENTSTLEVISLPMASLPKNARPGDTLVKQNSKWYVDAADTAARARRVNERFARIKAAGESAEPQN